MTPDIGGSEIERALAELAGAMAAESAPARVETALLDGFRARRVARRRAMRMWWTGSAIAAAAAVAMVGMIVPGTVDAPRAPRIVHAPPPPVVELARGIHQPARAAQGFPAARNSAARARTVGPPVRTERHGEPPYAVELTSDFFALRPGPMVQAGELASLVRVQLPRTEMRRFGLPGGLDVSELVQADIVIGQDGMARAVRFVSAAREQRRRY